ncbi:T9SS type A sorting domain-containing protein [uncultured Aquimarina sp.]|uniref:T9SS type A sorting domain-containing protein n=1 Tax=uncultured Aquimarina sp. TaxID=575652 RepID=UPI00262F941F|nr:T9SS type A sorting domain-containing protein [uncultured Aquimarina sp.]
MKKIKLLSILMFLLLSIQANSQIDIQNFQVTSPLNQSFTWNSGQRFDYKFDIQGNYGYNEIKLKAYAESVTSNNLIGLIRWNREGDDNLSFNSYTTKSMWVSIAYNWNGRSFTTSTSKKFYLVVEYQGNSQTYLYTIPDGDNDGDGISNTQDDCPNEAGPASNNGCPLGNPNLAVDLDASQVFSQCTTCFPWLDLFFNSGKRHLIANGGVGSIGFNRLEIRNIGNATSNSAKVKFYFSLNNTIGSSDKLLKTINMPSRNVNSSYGIQTTINGWDINNNGGLANGNYFILVDIDTDNSNNEGTTGEADNLLAIPITYTEENITSIISPFPISRQKNTNTQFELTVYNSQGTLVIERKVANKEEEKAFIQNLPKGFYIIKNGTDTYKIVKN